MPHDPFMSVIVPCYNEETVLRHCHSRLTGVLENKYGNEFEILYIDDGSTDHSVEILRSLHRDSPQTRVVMLSRNFGHQAAVTAGLTAAGVSVLSSWMPTCKIRRKLSLTWSVDGIRDTKSFMAFVRCGPVRAASN